jgi:hypothetical protein
LLVIRIEDSYVSQSIYSGSTRILLAICDGSRRFKFKKRRQLFIRTHNETLSVVPMRVSNPDRSPAGINR